MVPVAARAADTDGDGLCDGPLPVTDVIDTDGDGLEDFDRDGRLDPNETDPTHEDTDRGRVSDGDEPLDGTDPLDPSDDLVSTSTAACPTQPPRTPAASTIAAASWTAASWMAARSTAARRTGDPASIRWNRTPAPLRRDLADRDDHATVGLEAEALALAASDERRQQQRETDL